MQYKIFTDGGSRGNPGLAASAFVVYEDDNVIFKDAKVLGRATNNAAEYQAVIMALMWLSQQPKVERVTFVGDSELVVKQLNKIYAVKSPDIIPLVAKVRDLVSAIPSPITFTHVRRELNSHADRLVNEALDNHVE